MLPTVLRGRLSATVLMRRICRASGLMDVVVLRLRPLLHAAMASPSTHFADSGPRDSWLSRYACRSRRPSSLKPTSSVQELPALG